MPDRDEPLIFQVLHRKTASLRHVLTYGAGVAPSSPMSIQLFEVYAMVEEHGIVAIAHGEPEEVDQLQLTSMDAWTTALIVWDTDIADVQGCLHLLNPRPATPTMALTDSNCPTMTIMKALKDRGWTPVPHNVIHSTAGAPGCMSVTNSATRKEYYQCLLDLPALLAGGLPLLRSDQPISYYSCVLSGRNPPPNLGDTVYKKWLRGMAPALEDRHASSQLDDEILEALPAPPAPVLALPAPPTPAVSAHPETSSSSGSSSSSSSASSDSSDEVLGAAGAAGVCPAIDVPDVPGTIDGGALRYEDRRTRSGYQRYILKCTHHPNCILKRNIGVRQCNHFGLREPLGYLGAKQQIPTPNPKEHQKKEPSLASIKDWLIAHAYLAPDDS